MKRYLILQYLIFHFPLLMQAQYITLKGRQFYNQNNIAYYPKVLNYGVSLIYDDSDPANFEIAPQSGYGTSALFEFAPFTNGTIKILGDFKKIKSMGFNTVRLGIAPTKKNGSGFTTNAYHYPNPDPDLYPYEVLDINPPYSTNFYLHNILFPKIQQVLDLASQAEISVILLVGDGFIANNDANAHDYANYLGEMASHFQTHTALLAYDMDNEPHWETMYSWCDFTSVKNKVCEYTSLWYNSIKASDPNHLITIGGKGILDITDVDPGVIKVDFISEHIYPHESELLTPGYDKQIPIERLKGELYWLHNNLPIPWIIGEAGFPEDDLDVALGYNYEPYVWGHDADANYYALESQQLTLNYGGSGYSWWQFQNVCWYGPTQGANNYIQNFFGLLHFGNSTFNLISGEYEYPSPSVIDKPLVAYAFGTNSPTIPNDGAVQPPNYFNPYNHPPNPTKTITGTITNLNTGTAIKDAFIVATTDLGWTYNPDIYHSDQHYTFSDASGNFEVIPYANVLYSSGTGEIADIELSAIGAERLYFGWCAGCLILPNPIPLNKVIYDVNINGQVIPTGSPQYFQAKNTLTTSNILIQTGATAEFKATNEVHLLPGFDAESGSDVHIYCAPVFLDCNNYSSFQMQRQVNPYVTQTLATETTRDIELNFKKIKLENSLSVFPNPNNGFFTVELIGGDTIHTITILDMVNRIIDSYRINDESYKLDLSTLPKGMYIIRVSSSSKTYNQKIIIQ